MKAALLFAALFITIASVAQSPEGRPMRAPMGGRPPALKDSLAKVIAAKCQVKKEVADSVISYIDGSRVAISEVITNRNIPKEQRDAKLKVITDARDAKIAQLLTPEQIVTLKAVFAEEKERNRRAAAAGAQNKPGSPIRMRQAPPQQ